MRNPDSWLLWPALQSSWRAFRGLQRALRSHGPVIVIGAQRSRTCSGGVSGGNGRPAQTTEGRAARSAAPSAMGPRRRRAWRVRAVRGT